MTNREWLLEKMQKMSDEEFLEVINSESFPCNLRYECPCDNGRDIDCLECKIEILNEEHKEPIKLSDAERVILENIDKEYKWIVRDLDGELRVFEEKPIKIITAWGREENCFKRISAFNHLFQFIKWEDTEAYNIEELLKGE